MNVVYVHLGPKPLPSYFDDTLKQLRRYWDGNVWLIAPTRCLFDKIITWNEYQIRTVASEEFDSFSKNVEFKKVSFLDYTPDYWQGFWETTLQRTFYLEAFAREIREPILHMENDVVAYRNPGDFTTTFKNLFQGKMCCMDGAAGHSSLAYVYIDTPEAIGWLNDQWIEHLRKGQKHCVEFIADVHEASVNEMCLLRAIRRDNPDRIGTLPILPDGKGSDNFTEFDSLFDPMSWGQALCGTHQHPGVPYTVDFHWIGERINKGEFSILWDTSEFRPYVVGSFGKTYRLNNLHIHSKEVRKWIR